MNFSSSTIGITAAASANATRNSTREMCLEPERDGKRRNVDHGSGQREAAERGDPKEIVARVEREQTLRAASHVDAVQDFRQAQRDECHRHAVGTRRDLPDAGFHIVSDEIRRERQNRDDDALIDDRNSHAACEDAVFGIARRTGHDVRLCRFAAERHGGQAVRDEVDPKKMRGFQDREAQNGGGGRSSELHSNSTQEGTGWTFGCCRRSCGLLPLR